MAERFLSVLHDATLLLLERTGVRIASEAARDLLAGCGIRVDPLTERVYPNQEQICQALASVPASFAVYGRRTSNPLVIGGDDIFYLAGGGASRVLTLDGDFTPASWEHLRAFIILLDALPNMHLLPHPVTPAHDEPNLNRRIAAEVLCGSPKPCWLPVGDVDDLTALAEMGRLVRGSQRTLADMPVFITGTHAEPPLTIPAHAADILVEASRHGIPCGISDDATMGVTAPITPAGAAIQRNAMQLTALLLTQLSWPGAPFYYTASSGSANLHTLDPIAANPLAVQLARMITMLGRSYGIPIVGVAATDAKLPDAQANCEQVTLMHTALDAGVHVLRGAGAMMGHTMFAGYVQAIVDNEIAGYLLATRRAPELTRSALALEAMHEVATTASTDDITFSGHPHTVTHMPEKIWEPWVFDYNSFTRWQQKGGRTLADRAGSLAGTILRTHQPSPLASDVLIELARIAGMPLSATVGEAAE